MTAQHKPKNHERQKMKPNKINDLRDYFPCAALPQTIDPKASRVRYPATVGLWRAYQDSA